MKMKFFVSLICVGGSLFAKQQPAAFTDNGIYPTLCHELASDEARFANFKRDPLFTLFAENLGEKEGEEELRALSAHYPALLKELKCKVRNDAIGNPRSFSYESHGSFSPATLRYARIAGQLKQRFGSLEDKRLLEIGGGYGGLCTVLSDLFSLKSYTIIDLPECLELCAHYLTAQKIKDVTLVELPKIPKPEFDLVISYLFFSECDRSVQSAYIEQLLCHAPAGFLICAPAHWKEIPYSEREHKRVKPLPKEKILLALAKQGIKAEVCVEEPSSGKEHFVIFWKK